MSTTTIPKGYVARVRCIADEFARTYNAKTPEKLKILDACVALDFLVGVTLFVYCLLSGSFPFNAFLAAFLGTIAMFTLTICIRVQLDDHNAKDFGYLSTERAYADFALANAILHLAVLNYVG